MPFKLFHKSINWIIQKGLIEDLGAKRPSLEKQKTSSIA
jgi:hypothetical protein